MASVLKITIDENDEGWGPSTSSVPDKFKDVPYYAPFNKGDKIGKAADWQAQNQGKSKFGKEYQGQGVSTIFSWHYQDDDSTFQLVDNARSQLKKPVGRRFQNKFGQRQQRGHNFNQNQPQNQQRNQPWGRQQQQGQRKPQQQQGGQNRFGQRRWGDNSGQRKREASVEVKPDWNQVEQIEFAQLNKVAIDKEPEPQDIKTAGSLQYYDRTYDRVSTKAERVIERTDKTFFNVTTGDDPIIRQLSMEEQGTVFATDVILSHLMAAPRSVLPWDVIVTKVGSKLFFDKRDGSQFDFLTVNETSTDIPLDDGRESINSSASLAREATFINQSFSQQVLSKEEVKDFGAANPFASEGQVPASVGYRYRKWNLGNEIVLIARCEVDGLTKGKNKDTYISLRALNEFDLKTTDWRKRIDSQRGAVFATELKNNASKLAKWAVQAALAGTESIKIGFVSRQSQRDNFNHAILATQDYSAREFGTAINFNMRNAWGILKKIIDVCMKQETGKYVLMRDPEKPALKLYGVPEETFSKGAKDKSDE